MEDLSEWLKRLAVQNCSALVSLVVIGWVQFCLMYRLKKLWREFALSEWHHKTNHNSDFSFFFEITNSSFFFGDLILARISKINNTYFLRWFSAWYVCCIYVESKDNTSCGNKYTVLFLSQVLDSVEFDSTVKFWHAHWLVRLIQIIKPIQNSNFKIFACCMEIDFCLW
jgi:hypothetical protein